MRCPRERRVPGGLPSSVGLAEGTAGPVMEPAAVPVGLPSAVEEPLAAGVTFLLDPTAASASRECATGTTGFGNEEHL